MVKSTAATATPAKPPPSLKKENSSAGGQRSIQSFFTKKTPTDGTPSSSNGILKSNNTSGKGNAMAKPALPVKKPAFNKPAVKNMTPVPSSDAMGPSSSQENDNGGIPEEVEDNSFPSPMTPAKRAIEQVVNGNVMGSSPSRKVLLLSITLQHTTNTLYRQAKKVVSYAESDDDDDEDAFDPAGINAKRRKSRLPKLADDDDDEDTFIGGLDGADDDDDGKHHLSIEL